MDAVLQAFHTPLRDPVVVIALATTAFLVAPLLFERMRLPATAGFIVFGALLGPNGLNWIARDETIVLLGTVGLLYLMFMAAVEIDLHDFGRNRSRSLLFGVLGFLAPQLLGFAAGRALGYSLATSVLLGSMLSSHTLLAYPIVSRLGVAKNQAIMVAVGATIITDLLALLVLAGVATGAQGHLSVSFWARLAVSLAAFAVVVLKGLPALADWFFRSSGEDDVREYMFVLAALFGAAVCAHLAGVEPIIGAFLAGLALNARLPEGQPLTNRLNFFSDAFFTPFFLFSVGMLVDLRVLAGGPWALLVTAAMVATVLPAKWLAAWLTRRRFRYTTAEALTMFGLSVPQAAATLAIALIGYRVHLFDSAILNATIIIILVTSTLGPWLVERYGRRVAFAQQRRPLRSGSEPQRILIPVLGREDADALVDVALLLRQPGTREPLLPLAVVPPAGRATAASVAGAEQLLAHAVTRATSAGVTAVPLTRVAFDLVNGIARGVAESRATTLVVGWDRRQDRRRSVLRRSLDHVIVRSQQMVLVTSLAESVKTLKQLRVILPRAADRSPGFGDAMHTIKLMASRLTADVVFHSVGGDPAALERLLGRVRPPVPQRVEHSPDWRTLTRTLAGGIGDHTLVVLVSERHGLVSWERELDRMPQRLAAIARNLCVLYPRTAAVDQPHDDHVLAMLGEALQAGRVAAALPDMTAEQAMRAVLRTEFPEDSPRLAEARAAIEHDAAPVVPGAYLLFGRSQMASPLLFIGTSAAGIHLPQSAERAGVLVVILVPWDHRMTEDAYRDQLRPVLGNAARLQELARAGTALDVAALFRAEDQGTPPVATAA